MPEAQCKLLADTLDAVLRNERVLFIDEDFEALARQYCNLIWAKHPETTHYSSSQEQLGVTDDLVHRSNFDIELSETKGTVTSIEYHKVKQAEEESRFSGSYWLRKRNGQRLIFSSQCWLTSCLTLSVVNYARMA